MLQRPTQYKFASGCSTISSKSNPPIEAERTSLNGFLPSFYWLDYVSNLWEETAEHLLLSCPMWAAERQGHFGDSIDIKDVFRDYVNLVEFLISSGHLPLDIGIA